MILRANELRIGNYYDQNGEVKQVTPNTILEVWESERIWCKPISLTEEWMLKFGFQKSWGLDNAWSDKNHFIEVYNYNGVKEYDSGEKRVKGMVEGEYALCEDDGFVPISRPFKFVHQLQNLYFALTGEELTTK